MIQTHGLENKRERIIPLGFGELGGGDREKMSRKGPVLNFIKSPGPLYSSEAYSWTCHLFLSCIWNCTPLIMPPASTAAWVHHVHTFELGADQVRRPCAFCFSTQLQLDDDSCTSSNTAHSTRAEVMLVRHYCIPSASEESDTIPGTRHALSCSLSKMASAQPVLTQTQGLNSALN